MIVRTTLVIAALVLAACQAGAPLGATCERNAACSSPLVCRFGRCRSECAAQRDCPVGTTCLLDASGNGSCALIDDPDCSATGASCATPLACVGRTCVNVCTLGPECPAGSDCAPIVGESRARCVRSDGADAGVADASRIDARTDAGLCTPGGCDTPLQLALGDGFTCVRPMSGRIWCWGYGAAIARDGDMTGCTLAAAPDVFACPTPAPLRAEDDAMVVGDTMDLDQIDAQELGGCFATHAGVVSCWGTSISAAPLGRNVPTGERARTVQRNAGGTLNGIDRFFEFGGSAIAVDLSGAWYGWGTGAGNVLGLGTSSTLAQRLGAPLADARTVATGERHACGLSGGSVVCWGSNDDGESDPTAPSATPVGRTVIAGVTTATELMMGRSHSCALTDAGLVCWGQRAHLWFDGDVGSCHAADVDCGPTLVPTPGLVIAHLVPVRNADDFCAVDATDGLWCWGEGSAASGQRPARVYRVFRPSVRP